jgi:hypothetical protein
MRGGGANGQALVRFNLNAMYYKHVRSHVNNPTDVSGKPGGVLHKIFPGDADHDEFTSQNGHISQVTGGKALRIEQDAPRPSGKLGKTGCKPLYTKSL